MTPVRLEVAALFRIVAVSIAVLIAGAGTVRAHPAPFSYLDVHVAPDGLSGRIVLHDLDVQHDLGLPQGQSLASESAVRPHADAIAALLRDRLAFFVDGRPAPWRPTGVRALPDQTAVEMTWAAPASSPGKVTVAADVFPYDPNHQTFVNVYEGGALTRQEVLSHQRDTFDLFVGSRQGLWAVFTAFTASGIHHIAIGPDHILFIVGLLLLGGSIRRLLAIVTAFTLGHSLTLALATLQIVDPPSRLVEPAIALSIVYVGADNLLVGTRGRDVRPWVALFFGLVHGFGFASVLRETGLPPRALGLSLFSFNLGVEIGQAAIVLIVASALAALRDRNALWAARIATAGSVCVVCAGAFWFVERVW
jgi:hydrogenase/urease accessory protein HupE